ncbi:MAG: redox-sensing transcriptional repressor Rex [Elusimicrobiota bacterium]
MTNLNKNSKLQTKSFYYGGNKQVPRLVIPRLSLYYRLLKAIVENDIISSEEISARTGFSAAQVRRDLAFFGQFGVPGKGYNIEGLKSVLSSILGINQVWNVALCGAGNLGTALLGYKGFAKQCLQIVAAFDVNKKKIGKLYRGIKIYALKELPKIVIKENIKMAIVTAPAEGAQELIDKIIHSGIKFIINFAPLRLKVPNGVKVHNIDIAMEMEQLSFWAKQEM